jgi:hypothetical protein
MIVTIIISLEAIEYFGGSWRTSPGNLLKSAMRVNRNTPVTSQFATMGFAILTNSKF